MFLTRENGVKVIGVLILGYLTVSLGMHRKEKTERQTSDEQRLFRKLMRRYEKAVRPVRNSSHAVVVTLGITLTQIFDMDEKNQVLTTNVWLDQEWLDEKLLWDPKKYGGLERMRIPCDYIWLPDIVLYNSVDDYSVSYMRSLAMVTSDGTVFWPPIVRFRSSCKVDITYFPFDDQICKIKLGSWAYDGFQVDVTNRSSSVDLSNYVDNGEWDLIEAQAVRNRKFYACCPEPFPDVTFWFHLRRRTTYYTFNIIIPCVILSILTLAGFLLPAESGEKVTLGLTVLLAFSVFMLLIAENMPATSEFVPLIGLYLTVIMALTSMSVVFAVFILHIHYKGGRSTRAPYWLRKIALQYLGRVFCVRTSDNLRWHRELEDLHSQAKATLGSFNEGFLVHSVNNFLFGHPDKLPFHSSHKRQNTRTEKSSTHFPDAGSEVLKQLKMLTERQDKEEYQSHLIKEWQDIAVVVDRLLFCFFASVLLFSTVSLLVLKPMTKNVVLNAL